MIFALINLRKPLWCKDLRRCRPPHAALSPLVARTYVDSVLQIVCQKNGAEAPRASANPPPRHATAQELNTKI